MDGKTVYDLILNIDINICKYADNPCKKQPAILNCRTSSPETFTCLKTVHFAQLSTIASEHTFSTMNAALIPEWSGITPEYSEICEKLQVTTYTPGTEHKVKQGT